MPDFAWFFVHFDKLIRRPPGPLCRGGTVHLLNRQPAHLATESDNKNREKKSQADIGESVSILFLQVISMRKFGQRALNVS